MIVPWRVVSCRSRVRAWLLLGSLGLAALPARAAPADAQAEQRLTALLLTLDMARTACGFRLAEDRLAALLASENVTRAQLYGRPMTPALQGLLDGLQRRFNGNAASACAETWRAYGPSSGPNLLVR